jgi:hypothetical protein
MVYTMVHTMVLQKSVRVNEKSGGFLGVPWYIPWHIPWNIPWFIPSCQRAFTNLIKADDVERHSLKETIQLSLQFRNTKLDVQKYSLRHWALSLLSHQI